MALKTVRTQTELDAALADGVDEIIIDSPRGLWLTISDSGSATVEAYGSTTVRASDSATVAAYDSATVRASGSATVAAYGSATVRAYGSATVRASGSATVAASGSATVEASGSATVAAYGSATVEAYGSATVRASDSATVEAYGSATVRASGSATVRAYGSATVRAAKYVAVHLFSRRVTLSGGVLIDMTKVDATKLDDWCDVNGTEVTDGKLTVYKAVNDSLCSGRGFQYSIGTEVSDTHWRDDHSCGGGLHFSPTPTLARDHFQSATRFLECTVAAGEVRCIDSTKLKAPRATVVREVTLFGAPVEAKAAQS